MKINFWPLNYLGKISVKNILNLLIEFNYLLIIFLIPLWLAYWLPTYNIFEFNKLAVFKIFTLTLLFLTALKIIFYPLSISSKPLKFFKKYWLIPLVFIIGLSLTLLGSLNPVLSFYGLMDRQGGLLSYLFYFLFFILVSFNILTVDNSRQLSGVYWVDRNLKRVIVTIVISGFLVAFYGILQILNIDFLVWSEPPALTHRIFSTFGQPNFLASWLLLVIPLNFYLFWQSPRFLTKLIWLLAFGAQLIALFLTGSRGGVLALVFVGILFLIYLLIKTAWPRGKKYLVVLSFIFLALVSLWTLNYYSAGRVRQLANFNSGSLNVRLNFYQAAGTAIISRPFQGYGLENAENVFIKYYNSEWGVYGNVGQNTNRAHNLILDILLSTGVFGLILYSLYYYFFFSLIRDNLKNNWKTPLNLSLGLGAAGYLFSLLFGFTIVTTEIYFWLFLALLVVINFSGSRQERIEIPIKSEYFKIFNYQLKIFFKIIITIIITILIFWQINLVLKSLLADYYFNLSYISARQSNYLSALVLDNYMLREKPNPINLMTYDLLLSDSLSESFSSIKDLNTKSLVKQKLQKINKFLPAKGYKKLLVKAKIALIFRNYSQAKIYLAQIIAQTPFWPIVYLEAGKLALVQNNFKAALINYHLAFLNLPNPNDSRLNIQHRRDVLNYQYFTAKQIAEVYETEKNYVAAEKYYQLAYKYNPADFTLFKKIADTYYKRGDLNRAIKYVRRGQSRNPKDYHWSFALAVLFKDSGNYSLAQSYLAEALKLAPQNQELLNFKKELINN